MTLVAGRLAVASGGASGTSAFKKEERSLHALPQTPSHGKVREGAQETGHEHGARGRGSKRDGNGCPALSRDTLSRLTGLTAVGPGPTTITDFDYTYDAAGNRLTKAQLDYTEAYTYDPLYRLTDVARTGALTGEWHYRYDPVGNRLSAQVNGAVTTSTFNEKNQLVSSTGGGPLRVRGILDEPGTAKVNGVPASMVSGNAFEATIQATTGTNTFTVEATDDSGNVSTESYSLAATGTGATQTFDANGNLTQKVEGGVTWTYEWNGENQLSRVLSNGIETTRYEYDPIGRRVELSASQPLTWTYDGHHVLREIEGTTTRKYIRTEEADEQIAVEEGGSLSYFHHDALDTVVRVTNSLGTVAFTYRYEAFGKIESGATRRGFSYTGREWDPSAGLFYYRARYYDAVVGRFLNEDPTGFDAGVNFFAYVENNPVLFRDPRGLDLECVTKMVLVTAYCDKGPGKNWAKFKPKVKGGTPGSVGPGSCAVANTSPKPFPFGSKVFVIGKEGGVDYAGEVDDTGAGWDCKHHCVPPDQWLDIWLPCAEARQWGKQWRSVLICQEAGGCPGGGSCN